MKGTGLAFLILLFNLSVFGVDFPEVDSAPVYPSNQDSAVTDTSVSKVDKFNKTMEKIIVYSPLPVISYSTETNWMFGLTKINAFRIGAKDQYDTTYQPSQITALAYFTLNNQYKADVTVNLAFGHNKYLIYTDLLFIDFPNLYFGTGDDTHIEDECLVVTENFSWIQSFGYRISSKWYVGIKYHFNNYFKVDTVSNGEGCNKELPDLTVNEGLQSGLGFSISRETRDNRFNARVGSYLFFEYLNYGKWIGSKFNYNSIIAEYRFYFTPVKWLTIAAQIYSEFKLGDYVPIQSLALMGGDNRSRGIYIGRFRDKTMLEGQVELRFPIVWILGGVVFTGLGQVQPEMSKYSWNELRWTYGAGLRLTVNEATRSNLRFDVGLFRGQPLYFFTFSEAF